jgi:response regulator of citrate/malate metabolism
MGAIDCLSVEISSSETWRNVYRSYHHSVLIDVFMPDMNGFELSQRILELDLSIRVCFVSAAELNVQALREVYPKLSFGCFIKKPVEMQYLVERLCAELD